MTHDPTAGAPASHPPTVRTDKALEVLAKQDKGLLADIRHAAFQRALERLQDPKAKIPDGVLLGFVSKLVSHTDRPDREETHVRQQNIFTILPGLPEARRKQIIDGFQRELDKAKEDIKGD